MINHDVCEKSHRQAPLDLPPESGTTAGIVRPIDARLYPS